MTAFIKDEIITNVSELEKVFHLGCKTEQKIGIEYEKLVIHNDNFRAVSYYEENGIKDFLLKLKPILHAKEILENGNIIGLQDDDRLITLEPGAQVELSLSPQNNVYDIYKIISKYNEIINSLAKEMNFSFIDCGLHPVSTYDNIEVIPKKRYEFMGKYLPQQAKYPLVMMRETAGIQIAIDFESEEDAIEKFSLALKLSPFMTGLFANSPYRNKKLTKYKSFRAFSWLHTDSDRCGLVSKKIIEFPNDYSFKDYVNYLIDIPMIFRGSEFVGKIPFKSLLNSSNPPTEFDWNTQISLNFSDVRLKPDYIEIRNHDLQKEEYLYSIPAIYRGILYSKSARHALNELLKRYNYEDYKLLASMVPVFGLNFSYKNLKMFDVVKEIVMIAREGLKLFNNNDGRFIDALEQLVKNQMTPSDIMIKYSSGDIAKVIQYSVNN